MFSVPLLLVVETLVRDVFILNRGQIVSFGRLDELLRSTSSDFIANVSKPEAIRNRLIKLPSIEYVKISADELLITTKDPEILFKELPHILATENAILRTFHPVQDSLEKHFFEVINSQKGRRN